MQSAKEIKCTNMLTLVKIVLMIPDNVWLWPCILNAMIWVAATIVEQLTNYTVRPMTTVSKTEWSLTCFEISVKLVSERFEEESKIIRNS